MLYIKRNLNGSFSDNRSLHTADMTCDTCGYLQPEVNMNSVATYVNDNLGNHTGISLSCSAIGGTCSSVTFWPLNGGTPDSQELALVKSA